MSLASIEWALAVLQSFGYVTHRRDPETVQNKPWSCVYRFSTDQGDFYLKQVPSALSLEADVIQMLQVTCAAPVPSVVANNPNEHCFLMKDAGIPLREFFKQGFDVNIFVKAIRDYIAMQRATMDYLPIFLDMDVPDWRLSYQFHCFLLKF